MPRTAADVKRLQQTDGLGLEGRHVVLEQLESFFEKVSQTHALL